MKSTQPSAGAPALAGVGEVGTLAEEEVKASMSLKKARMLATAAVSAPSWKKSQTKGKAKGKAKAKVPDVKAALLSGKGSGSGGKGEGPHKHGP